MVSRRTIAGLSLLACSCLRAEVGAVQIRGTTATQAILSYTAPGEASCQVLVSESPSFVPLAHDIDASLFPGSDQDNRPGSISRGRERLVVIGKRTAEQAADGKRYSRALQAATPHYFRVTCGAETATGSFATATIPYGLTWNDPLPADPARPGEYAWPTFGWTNRTEAAVDPQTGLLLRRLSLPHDSYEDSSAQIAFVATRDPTNAWTGKDGVLADDSSAATFSGTDPKWLYLAGGLSIYQGGKHTRSTSSMDWLKITVNAWCSGGNCASASAADRTIQACLSVDGVSCATAAIEQVLSACTSNCTASGYRFTMGTETPILAAWTGGGTPAFDITNVHKRAGNVNRNGAAVTYASGNYFDLKWTSGSKIAINGVEYTIASVDNERQITLSGSPAGNESGVAYSAQNFGILLRKKTPSTHQISVQYASYQWSSGGGSTFDPAGDMETWTQCSRATVAGPNGEQGYHCNVSGSLYWIGQQSGTVNKIGYARFPARAGTDGWAANWCTSTGGVWFDPTDANSFYCAMSDNSTPAGTVVVQAKYYGSNTNVGGNSIYATLTECNAGRTNQPCHVLTNLTPTSTGSITAKVAAFHPYWTISPVPMGPFALVALQDKYLLLSATAPSGQNDTLGWFAALDITTRQIVAAAPSWRYWPFRWTVLHGSAALGYADWMFFSGHVSLGSFGGGQDAVGRGPWRTKITSGAVGSTGAACPARPPDSPILEPDWPTGNRCVQVTVQGEPCDPSRTEANSSKCGNSTDGYLMDAAVRDVFCGTADPSVYSTGCGLYSQTEVFRLVVKNGNTWTLQRAYSVGGSNKTMFSLPENSTLTALPASCSLSTYPCNGAAGYWNFTADPYGYNTTGTAAVIDRTGQGGGHGTLRPGGAVASLMEGCPAIDGQSNGCYNLRPGDIPELFTTTGFFGPSNPPFAGKTGIGQPNETDGHPSQPNYLASGENRNWFVDARPFLGTDWMTGRSDSPGSLVTGTLYRFTAGQLPRLRRKQMPTLASCGSSPLTDVSGPLSAISGDAADNYRYCVANRGGECYTGSTAGDVYVNCPQASYAYCRYMGIGNEDYDYRNICIGDNGAFTQGITQTRFTQPDLTGAGARLLTRTFSAYRNTNTYWIVKGTPDGKWLIVQSPWFQGQRSEALLVKSPPLPARDTVNRGDFVPVKVTLTPPAGLGIDNAVVEFGYDENFFCTSRREACVKGNQSGSDYSFESEAVAGVPCAAGCTIAVPAIGQRVVYWRTKYRDASNQVLRVSGSNAVVVP